MHAQKVDIWKYVYQYHKESWVKRSSKPPPDLTVSSKTNYTFQKESNVSTSLKHIHLQKPWVCPIGYVPFPGKCNKISFQTDVRSKLRDLAIPGIEMADMTRDPFEMRYIYRRTKSVHRLLLMLFIKAGLLLVRGIWTIRFSYFVAIMNMLR